MLLFDFTLSSLPKRKKNQKFSPMTDPSDEAKQIEKLYEFGERLNEAKDKSQVLL